MKYKESKTPKGNYGINQRQIDFNIGYNAGLRGNTPARHWKNCAPYMQGHKQGHDFIRQKKLKLLLEPDIETIESYQIDDAGNINLIRVSQLIRTPHAFLYHKQVHKYRG